MKWAGTGEFQLQGGGFTQWFGVGGLTWDGFNEHIRDCLRQYPCPTTLIIHLGTNDIFGAPLGDVRKRIRDQLHETRNILPFTRIIWSDILPRLFYHGELRAGAGERDRSKLNKCGRKACLEAIQGHVIKYKDLFPRFHHHLYRWDGIHLSKQGNLVFRQHLENSLLYFNEFPSAFQFPPAY